jgi:hypothetical protein
MKDTICKINKEIRKITSCEFLEGDIYLSIALECKSYLELDNICDEILSKIEIPENYSQIENNIYNKRISIYISFNKI